MDMNEAARFTQLDGLDFAPRSPSLVILLCLTLATLAWVFMNIWSVNLVSSGIWSVKLFPPSFGETLVLMFAIALQCIPALLGLITPYAFKSIGRSLGWVLAVALCAGVVGFEMYHSALAQYKNSTGAAVYAQERAEIDALNRKLNNAGAQLVATYTAKMTSFQQLAADAASGRDETGIAKCRGICQEFRRKYAVAKSRYSHLANPPASATSLRADADLREHLTDIGERSTQLVAAGKDLSTFYWELDNTSPPAMLADEIAGVERAVKAKSMRFADMHSLSPATLALEQTNAAFAAINRGAWPAAEARLPLVYGVLPAMCVLVLAFFMRVCIAELGPNYYGLGHVVADIARETVAQRMLKRLVDLRSANFVQHIRAKYKQWSH